ncbi:hypothetical protein K438DRAFT_1993738 [Mycena galopus ATCC 62051]|nr:hypothetical protein K438DRAFT_1993738 [Mycena galopus ATCC 62051]
MYLYVLSGAVTTSQRNGRGIRKVAALWGEVSEIIINAMSYEKKKAAEDDGEEDIDEDAEDLTEEENAYLVEKRDSERNLEAYRQIERLVPNLHERLRPSTSSKDQASQEIMDFFRSLQKGANDARSEDIRMLSKKMAEWLNEMEQARFKSESEVADALSAVETRRRAAAAASESSESGSGGAPSSVDPVSAPDPVKPAHYINPNSRAGRGIQDDLCGGFICAYEHEWEQETVRDRIRSGNLFVGESFYIPLLYKDFKVDPDDLEHGLFQSELLGYLASFTSPSSSDGWEQDENLPPQKRAAKSSTSSSGTIANKNVATILGMNGKVTGRTIAYVAVIEWFVLTDAPHWRSEYYGVSLPQLYNFIVDFFEGPQEGTEAKKRVNKLLAWWNKQIFPNHASSTIVNRSAVSSYDKLKAQRAAKEHRRT